MKILLVMLMAGTLAACSARKDPQLTVASNNIKYLVEGADITEFALNDGTRCVVYRHTGGITCDWQRPVVLVPQVQ